jgi:tetratricopeptide (TPR) repeat protein
LTGSRSTQYRYSVASLRAWSVVVLLGVLATAARAHAETAEAQVERLAAEAVNAYKGADYNRAIDLLQRAYEIRQVPALLYNMAKAYDKLGDVDHAYETYRRYADSADADPRLKAKSEARIAVLETARRKRAAEQRAMEPKPAPPQTAQQPQPPPQPAEVEPPKPPPPTAAEIAEKLKQERQRARRRDRYVALGLGVATVAFAGVAIGFSVDALNKQSQWSQGYGMVPEATRRDQKDSALRSAAIADGFYAATGVAAAVTAYFIYRGFRPEPSAPSLALVPVASPAGGALVVTGRF